MAEPARTHYDVLGVPTGADAAEIRRAYLVLARRFHPDAHADRSPAERAHAERRMRDVNEAWADLSDTRRRQAYDAKVLRPEPAPVRRPPPGRGWTPRADDASVFDGRSLVGVTGGTSTPIEDLEAVAARIYELAGTPETQSRAVDLAHAAVTAVAESAYRSTSLSAA